jgi:hypothetical protein
MDPDDPDPDKAEIGRVDAAITHITLLLRHNHKHCGRHRPDSMEWHIGTKAARTLRCWLYSELTRMERLTLWGNAPFPRDAGDMRERALMFVPRRISDVYFSRNTDCLPPRGGAVHAL